LPPGARRRSEPAASVATEDEFMSREFGTVSIDKLGLDPFVGDVLKHRLDEIRECLTASPRRARIWQAP
jgi:hypothetical protein